MDSGMISKIEKSKRYAEEPARAQFEQFRVAFQGEHSTYTVSFDNGQWDCQCSFFKQRGVCSHTMALERILGPALQRHVEPKATDTE